MGHHDDVSDRVTSQTPFAALRSTFSTRSRQQRGSAARSYNWIGRISHVWREADKSGRMAFLFDVEPLNGGPAAYDNPTISRAKGAKAMVVSHVRLAQPYCGNIFNRNTTATGIIVVPEAGSLVLVSEDPHGWIITGFLTGPSFPFGSLPALGESTQNPGIEEISNTLYAPAFISRLYDLSEGDIAIGRDKMRVRFSKEGLFLGASELSCDLFRADGRKKFSRFIDVEERGPGYLGYKKTFFGFGKIPGFTLDNSLLHTEIVDTNTDPANLRPYVVRQVGHISSDNLNSGRYAGEIEPSPLTTMIEQQAKIHSVIRETVVQPIAPPTGTVADSIELNSASGVVYDFQVRADGSFHIRSGKAAPVPTPGVSKYGIPTDNTLDLQFDALTKILKLRLGVSGAPLVNVIADGNVGTLTVLATTAISLQAPIVNLPIATQFVAAAALSFHAPSISMIADGNFSIAAGSLAINGGSSGSWVGGTIAVPGDVTAGAISLLMHTHNYVLPAVPAATPPNPGISTPPLP